MNKEPEALPDRQREDLFEISSAHRRALCASRFNILRFYEGSETSTGKAKNRVPQRWRQVKRRAGTHGQKPETCRQRAILESSYNDRSLTSTWRSAKGNLYPMLDLDEPSPMGPQSSPPDLALRSPSGLACRKLTATPSRCQAPLLLFRPGTGGEVQMGQEQQTRTYIAGTVPNFFLFVTY